MGEVTSREALHARVIALIDRLAGGDRDDGARDALLVDIARWQARHVAPYRRLVQARGIDPETASSPDAMPAIPTDVFRVVRVAAHEPTDDIRVFLTSGTTSGARGSHHARDLSLYDRAAQAGARQALFPEGERMLLVNLVPQESEAPESSLGYMVARFQTWFGTEDSTYVWRDGGLDIARLVTVLDQAVAAGRPVTLLGTSFAFIFAEDGLGESVRQRWTLPPGSRIMQTGGFKGRTRRVEPAEMRSLLEQRYGVPERYIIAEYGMTELSSQMYETPLIEELSGQEPGPRRLRAPGWMRVVMVDPETLQPVADDGMGLIRIEDPANLDTAWAIQTADLGRSVGPGEFELFGRTTGATPRGCSLAVEEALGGHTPG